MNGRLVAVGGSGIRPEWISREALACAYERLRLDPGDAGPIALAGTLEVHFELRTPRERLGVCQRCCGRSDMLYPGCPFCGETDDEHFTPEKVDALDAAMKLVREARYDSAHGIGVGLNVILDQELWRARRALHGRSRAYKSFSDFVRAEVGCAAIWARTLMRIAREFSEEDIRKLRASKLETILKADPNLREALLARARVGASRDALRRMARAHNIESPPEKPRRVYVAVSDELEWIVPLVAASGRLKGAPARDVVGADALGGAQVAEHARISLRLTRAVDGTLRAVVRLVRTGRPKGPGRRG